MKLGIDKKITFVSSRLGKGGAEKHLMRLINELIKEGFQVDLLLTKPNGSYERELHDSVHIHYLNMDDRSYFVSLVKSVIPLYKYLKKMQLPEVFAVQDGPILLALMSKMLSGEKTEVTGWVQNNPTHLKKSLSTRMYYWGIKQFYPRLKQLISLSDGVGNEYISMVPSLKGKIFTINNIGYPDTIPSEGEKISFEKDYFHLIACGRLEPQKNYFMMLKAFKSVVSKQKKVKLHILGEGKLRPVIEAWITREKLNNTVILHDFVKNPYPYMASAQLFIHSASFEGFGNVIVESMALGVPVISTDCPHGPAEIITHTKNGFLVPVNDEKKMAEAILFLIRSDQDRDKLSREALKRANEFSAARITQTFVQTILN